MNKELLRTEARKLIPADAQLRQQKSQRIVEILLTQKAFLRAKQIAIFSARSHEVDLSGLVRHTQREKPRGASPRDLERFFFPKVENDSLNFYRVQDIAHLKAGYAGIFEPISDPKLAAKSWEKTDIILVPGLLFDAKGGRIGSGKGFYDRFLATNQAQKWGIGFSEQIWKEGLAQEATDVRMGAIVTDGGFKEVAQSK